ncbi:MAG: ATP-dependent protease LonB [Syntrophomonadaceae bacterium]|nr:ATP-dependent protease LonB [Syntrophomonadaceae bacterium]
MEGFIGQFSSFILLLQLFFGVIIGLYFFSLLKSQQGNRLAVHRQSQKELDQLQKMRRISLTEPLSERTRPSSFREVIGQEEGLKALRAALCGPNPQHVIIYGPPGVGKTAAARLVLEEAKKSPHSPFGEDSRFIEIDATATRFDERGIADPLIGSVHDPIYQGAGPMGMAGIPQPKPGAVTKAHGGFLFIDEIGELHPVQMNKLLKVLEDRKVFLESAYYSSEDPNIPAHIHDIFQNGLPADFRLIGATTRMPHQLPPALRSRCLEVFFRSLQPEEIGVIAANAARKINFQLGEGALEVIKKYAANGREAVNMVQIASGLALGRGSQVIQAVEAEWVVNSGQYSPRNERKIHSQPKVGLVNGLAVTGANLGTLLEVEASALPSAKGKGRLIVTGVVEEEEIAGWGNTLRRKSLARSSVENVLTVLRHFGGLDPRDFDIHVNFPGGAPVDGPSAGLSIATAVYSAMKGLMVNNRLAMTGEVSVRGEIKPVGGIMAKVEAARRAGVEKVLIPVENWQEIFRDRQDIEVVPVSRLEEVFKIALLRPCRRLAKTAAAVKADPGVSPSCGNIVG